MRSAWPNVAASGLAVVLMIAALIDVLAKERLERQETAPAARLDAATRETRTRASWYGPGFARRPTASGRVFNPNELTAAHRTLPFGTDVRVTNLSNGRTVVVRITDRGPYVEGRGIDLSLEAARRLGMVREGVQPVMIETLPPAPERAPVPVALASWPLQVPRPGAVLR